MKTKIISFVALQAFARYGEYGEQSGLTDDECLRWDSYIETLEDLTTVRVPSHVSASADDNDWNTFGWCEVTRMHGAVTRYDAVYMNR